MEKENKSIKTKLEELKEKRKSKPTNAQMDTLFKEQDENAYKVDKLMLYQLEREEGRILGNAKLNEDEYVRKKGRMKVITPNFEWELDEIQKEIDEKRLQQTYEDTRMMLSVQLEKLDLARNKIKEQIKRLETKNPEFKDVVIDYKKLEEKYDEKVKSFTPNR